MTAMHRVTSTLTFQEVALKIFWSQFTRSKLGTTYRNMREPGRSVTISGREIYLAPQFGNRFSALYVFLCAYVCMYAYIYVCTYLRTYVFMYVCMYSMYFDILM